MNLPFVIDPMVTRFFLLLLAGHFLSDFLFQSSGIARNKGRKTSALLIHGWWTYVVHAVVLFPFWNAPVLLWVLVLALVHIGIDWLKPRIHRKDGNSLSGFFLDQSYHLITLVALAWLISGRANLQLAVLTPSNVDPYVKLMVVLGGFAFNGKGGTAVVRLILDSFPNLSGQLREDRADAYAMGLMIGILERFILFLMVLLGYWSALGFVIAAKSIARFKELDEKGFADYYLIGTLASVLVALLSGVTVNLLLGLL